MISALSNFKVSNKIAFTGEITLRGNIIKVGSIKENKFVFMEIDNRNWEKVNAGINNFYFDKIVSMRVTKRLGDESRYEDITKRAWTSPHDIKRYSK